MPKASPIFTAFNNGEMSPLTDGQINLARRQTGLRACQNMIPIAQGAVTRRGGTRFVLPVKDSAKRTAIIRFEFSTEQAYIIEVGDQYMRFYTDNGIILESNKTITNATQANPVVITSASHSYSNGDWVYISSVSGMVQLNGKYYKVANQTTNTFELQDVYGNNVDGTSYSAYISGGTAARVYEISTDYTQANLFDSDNIFQIKYAQSADVMYLTHPLYATKKLSRTGNASWTLADVSFQDGAYLTTNITSTTLTPSGTSGSITLTASAVTGINQDTGFQTTDVGRLVRFKDSANNWTWLTITARSSTTVVTATVSGAALASTTASSDWRLGVWSDTTGFPSTVTFFQDRLCFGGVSSYPQRIDMSNSGDYENFAPTAADGTVADDNAIGITINASNVNVIRWLEDNEKGLLAGTVGGEWIIRASTQGEAITPTNIQATRSTTRGSANIQPITVGKGTLFIQRARRKLHELGYSFENDGFLAPDFTLFANHITKGGIIEMSYQAEPYGVIWFIRSDGTLLGFTYESQQDVISWHRHIIGGYSDSDQTTQALVESIATIPSVDTSRDELWLIVNRYIDGSTKRYVEYMANSHMEETAQEDAVHVDSSLEYSGSPTATITGLDHLEGQTVKILAEGAAHPDKTVSSGSITLDNSYTKVQVGLSNTWQIETLNIESGSADGTAQGKTKRIHRAIIRLWNTLGVEYGIRGGELFSVPFEFDQYGNPPSLFTGDKTLDWNDGYDTEGRMLFESSEAFPATILAIMPQLVTYDR